MSFADVQLSASPESKAAIYRYREAQTSGESTDTTPSSHPPDATHERHTILVMEPASAVQAGRDGRQFRRLMATTLQRLALLLIDRQDYDDEFLEPSRAAYDFAWAIVAEAFERTNLSPPSTSPTTTDGGSIFLQWGDATGYVRLMVPHDPSQATLSYKAGIERGLLREPTGSDLVNKLEWLAEVRRGG